MEKDQLVHIPFSISHQPVALQGATEYIFILECILILGKRWQCIIITFRVKVGPKTSTVRQYFKERTPSSQIPHAGAIPQWKTAYGQMNISVCLPRLFTLHMPLENPKPNKPQKTKTPAHCFASLGSACRLRFSCKCFIIQADCS